MERMAPCIKEYSGKLNSNFKGFKHQHSWDHDQYSGKKTGRTCNGNENGQGKTNY